MIRYRDMTEEELAARDAPKPTKLSTIKRQHHARQKEKPPRKVAGRHAAPKPRNP